jgi:hypothetical protein
VRFDPALIHQPTDHIGRALAPIRDQPRRGEVDTQTGKGGAQLLEVESLLARSFACRTIA